MTLEEIKAAVDAGQTVHWSSRGYVVVKDSLGRYHIKFITNGHCIGLTWADGLTMNGRPEEFFAVCPHNVPCDTAAECRAEEAS